MLLRSKVRQVEAVFRGRHGWPLRYFRLAASDGNALHARIQGGYVRCRSSGVVMLGRSVLRRGGHYQRMDSSREGRASHHHRATGSSDLDDARAAKNLCRTLTRPSNRQTAICQQPKHPAQRSEVMAERTEWHREKRSGSTTLKPAALHLAHQLRIRAPTGSARREVGPRQTLILIFRGTCRVGRHGAFPVVTHATRRSDHSDPVELAPRRALSSPDSLDGHPEHTSGQLHSRPSDGHDRDHIPLKIAELRHEVSRSRDTVLQLDEILRTGALRNSANRNRLKSHTGTASDPQTTTTLTIVAQQQLNGCPERAHQVLVAHDRSTHHHDDADRLAHDLLKHADRHTTSIASRTHRYE